MPSTPRVRLAERATSDGLGPGISGSIGGDPWYLHNSGAAKRRQEVAPFVRTERANKTNASAKGAALPLGMRLFVPEAPSFRTKVPALRASGMRLHVSPLSRAVLFPVGASRLETRMKQIV